MTLNKKTQAIYNKVVNADATFASEQMAEAIALCVILRELYETSQERVKVLRATNSDLNRALRERSLELSLFEERQSTAHRERSYSEWQKGVDETLTRITHTKDLIEREGSKVRSLRRREVAVLVLLIIVNCICLGLTLYVRFWQ